ncbi:MAG: hypothetical protein RR232_06140 [Clostridia bacterium]
MAHYHEIENYMVLPEALEKHYGGKQATGAAERESSAYAQTERRLFALPILRSRVDECRDELAELESCGIDALKAHSSSMVRLLRPGIRLTPEEVHAAQLSHIRARLLADEREIKKMQSALNSISDDPYFLTVELRYFHNQADVEAARRLCCDPTTVRRNRKKLVRQLALRLYGSEAL